MRSRRFTIRRALWLAFGLSIAAGIAAPYLHADRFGDRIRGALERSLNRKVEIAEVRFSLFRGPGFTLRGAVIHDDPSAGIEPFAYVTSIEARVRLTSLLRGRLEFASLRLEEPSVNLVKTAGGAWNFQPLLHQAAAAQLPAITVSNGRLNFKLGSVKSVFYVSNADLEVRPPSEAGGVFTFSFSGEPARTDRTARGFGTLGGRGRWRPETGPGGNLSLEIDLAKSSLGELVALTHGHDIGIHGQLGGHASLTGSVSSLDIAGNLELSEIHRWDLLPPYGQGGPLKFRGRLDMLSQNLDIETVPAGEAALAVRLRVSDYLSQPQWAVSLTMDRFPIQPLAEVARHMGVQLPPGFQIEGGMRGAIVYTPDGGFSGGVLLRDAVITMPDAAPARLQNAWLTLEGWRVRLSPAVMSIGANETARLEFDYRILPPSLDLRLSTDSMSVRALRRPGGPVPGLAGPALVSALGEGTWRGWLRYRSEGDARGVWSGALDLKDTRVTVPGLAQTVELGQAGVKLQGDRLSVAGIEGRTGEISFHGDYRYDPGSVRPHHVSLRFPTLEASRIETLLAPTLIRRQGFISRTLRLPRAPVPDWLAGRRAEGEVEIGSLTLAGESFESVRFRFFWDGAELDVPRFQARIRGGAADGYFRADMSGPLPSYVVGGEVTGAGWRGGNLDGDATIRGSGSGDDLYWNLRADGWFRANSVTLAEDLQPRTLSGLWDLHWERKEPRLGLAGLRFADGAGVLVGQGLTLEGAQLRIDLASGEKFLRLTGSLKPIRLEVIEKR
jgi:hypothetical protein